MKIKNTLGRFAAEAARAILNHAYEIVGDGTIHIPSARAFVGGVFRHAHAPAGLVDKHGNPIFGPWAVDPNRVVNEGLNYILNAALGGGAQSSQFYLAPFAGNVTPAADWKGSTFTAQATEFTAYAGATRVPWNPTTPSTAQVLTNAAALAASTITYNAGGPYNLYGIGLLTASAKSATTGPLIAGTRFATPRTNQLAGDKVAFEYAISAKDEGAP